jgi:type II restriction enzyme
MESKLSEAIKSVQQSDIAFSKYIKANDTGSTGGHQSGFHIHKKAWPLLFAEEGVKGSNKDKFVKIKWQDDFETDSRFIYYGVGTRNEYRLTRFGKGFPFLQDDNIGDLLIISKKSDTDYEAFVLQSDEDIESFFSAVNISSNDTNGLIPKQFEQTAEDALLQCFNAFLNSVEVDFPPTFDLATSARNCYFGAYKKTVASIQANPDREILNWLDAEFQLFKIFENDRYAKLITDPFENVEALISSANTILNRRKSRAGRSLEHHLEKVFHSFGLTYDTQATTEGKKKPDFLFPSEANYKEPEFDTNKLIVLAAKTTCKDRWRQILNEADRIKTKHLFTLQQGISTNQLKEMYKYNVKLVVPKRYLTSFPEPFRDKIFTLDGFVGQVKSIQK